MAGSKATVKTYFEANTKHFEVHMKAAAKAADNTRKSQARLDRQNSLAVKGFSKAAAAASVLHGPLNGVSGRLTAMASALRQTNLGWVAFGGVMTAGVAALTASVRSLAAFEVQMKRVIAVQEAVGYASGFTGDQIHEMSQRIAADTLASVDGIMGAAAALGTFNTISGDNFEKTLRLSQDVAEVMGTDVQNATIQMAKAMQDPEKGLTALSRAGVTFTEQTRAQIDAAIEFGEVIKAQELILNEVESQLGGVGKAVSDDTLIGGWDLLTQNVQNFMRTSTIATTVMGALKDGLDAINKALGNYNAAGPVNELDAAYQKAQRKAQEYQKFIEQAVYSEETANTKRYQMIKAEEEWRAALEAAKVEAVNREKARLAGIAEQEKAVQDARIAAHAKFRERHARIDEKYQKDVAAAQSRAAKSYSNPDDPVGTTNASLEAEGLRLEARLAAIDSYYSKVSDKEKLHGNKLTEWNKQRNLLIEAALQEHLLRMDQIRVDGAKMQQKINDDTAKLEEEQAIGRTERVKTQLDEYKAVASGASEMFSAMGGLFAEGSKQQRAFAIASQASSLIAATASVGQAMADAIGKAGSPYLMAAAMAQAAALGARAIAMVQGARGAKAMGGSADPGSYWVGERGPEIVHFNRPAHVTKASDAGGVTVNLIEDASRAGTQSIDEAGIVQIAVASIRGELQRDITSGRGIFRQAEQQYGLNRTR